MKSFVDSKGRVWPIEISYGSIKRVQGLCGVNLANLLDGQPPLLTRLDTEIELLCNVVYALAKPTADQLQVTDEQFGEALGGEVIFAAHSVFWEELKLFFQSLRRTELVKAIEKQQAMLKAAVKAAETKVAAINVEAVVDQTFGDLASN